MAGLRFCKLKLGTATTKTIKWDWPSTSPKQCSDLGLVTKCDLENWIEGPTS